MPTLTTQGCDFNLPAPDFTLPGVDGKTWTRDTCKGEHGLLVMFICNHCPYVKAVRERIVRDARELLDYGIGSVAIMANDPTNYPEDSFENMQQIAQDFNFSFPYLFDEKQEVARAYGAVCTPDFFGFNAQLKLQYRGRLDASRREASLEHAHRDLFVAMQQIAKTGLGPINQIPSIGCSIKWRTA